MATAMKIINGDVKTNGEVMKDDDVTDVTDKILNLSIGGKESTTEVVETSSGNDSVLADEFTKKCNVENQCAGDKIVGKVSQSDGNFVDDEEVEKSTANSSCVHIYPKEIKVEEKGKPVQYDDENLEERGPTHGRATAFLPSSQTHSGILGPKKQPMSLGNYGYRGYNFQPRVMPNIGFSTSTVVAMDTRSGKRGLDEEMIPPFKYNRPPDEVNDLDNPQNSDNSNTFLNSVNRTSLCGGQVMIKSPDIKQQTSEPNLSRQFSEGDAIDILQMLEDSQDTQDTMPNGYINSGEQYISSNVVVPNASAIQCAFSSAGLPQVNMTSVLTNPQANIATLLTNPQAVMTTTLSNPQANMTTLTNLQANNIATVLTNECRDNGGIDCGVETSSDGYSSELSPLSDTTVLSPPPSNMSNISSDSGVSMGSVLSPKGATMDVASPRSQLSGYDGMSASPRSQNGCYDGLSASPRGQNGCYDGMTASPRSQLSGYDGMSASPRSQNGCYDGMMTSPMSQNGCYDGMMTSPQSFDGMPDPTRNNMTMASPRSQHGGYDTVQNKNVMTSSRSQHSGCEGMSDILQTNLNVTSPKGQQGYEGIVDMTSPIRASSTNQTGVMFSNFQTSAGYGPNIGVQPAAQENVTSDKTESGGKNVTQYIDEHLDTYCDIMNILTRDMLVSKVANRMAEKPMNIPAPNIPVSTPLGKTTVTVPTIQPAPPTSAALCMTTSVVLIPQSNITMTSPATSTMIPITVTQPVNNTGLGKVSKGPGNVPNVMTSQIVLIPASQQPRTIVVVNPTPAPQRRVPQFVPIKPKLPTTIPHSSAPPVQTTTATSQRATKGSNSPKHQKKQGVMNIAASSAQQAPKPVPSTSLKKCVGKNQLNIARRLVATMSRDNIQYKDKDGDTYLHVAVCKTDRYLVQALLERQVREELQCMVDVQNNLRQTPLYLAVSANQPEMVSMLTEYKADVNIPAECILDNGMREVKAAIHCAASQGQEYLSTLQMLMKHPEINLNQPNSDGQTALHCAIRNHGKPREDGVRIINSIPIIEFLIKCGADPSAQDKKSGKTPLMYAMESRNVDLIERTVRAIMAKDPVRFSTYLKAHSFDGKSCLKILDSMRPDFDPIAWERLSVLLPINGRGGVSMAAH
ncbi:uncharacterized protein LOC121386301 isoform X2 [Gigantopelta aegis]|nr:uncharacterized protein LOC121386301 isoform X2 [Gigantopelta aegis]